MGLKDPGYQDDSQKLIEQLMLLKSVTLRTGAIHEAQALQLKTWPTLIEGIEKSVARVDVENKKVIFNLTPTESFSKSQLFDRMLAEISGWTKTLLWDETHVVFKLNRKVVYDSLKV